MDAKDWVAIIGAIFLGLCQLTTVILAYITSRNIRKVEVNTNSMKDALIAAALEKGKVQGKEEEKANPT